MSYAETKVRSDIDLFHLFAGKIANMKSCRMKQVINDCFPYVDRDFVN